LAQADDLHPKLPRREASRFNSIATGLHGHTPQKIRPRFPEARCHKARDVHPAALPSWCNIVTAIGAVKLLPATADFDISAFIPAFFGALAATGTAKREAHLCSKRLCR
jgi:hypothetical protein